MCCCTGFPSGCCAASKAYGMVSFPPTSKYWISFQSERVSYSWYLSIILLKNVILLCSYRLQCNRKCCSISTSRWLAELTQSVFSGLPGLSLTTSFNDQFLVTCVVIFFINYFSVSDCLHCTHSELAIQGCISISIVQYYSLP